jgi:meso-butanediol dehydrogenase / (S,S)-butanediol dehydrogenase / diacetyl reductase
MRFADKVVLITGSGAGIGRAAALAYVREGAKVVVNSHSRESGAQTLALVRDAGGAGLFIQGDVSIDEDACRLVDGTVDAFGAIDILVNNAGIVLPGRIDTIDEDDWERTFAVNVKGPYLVSRRALKYMREKGGGVIVNVASVAAQKGVFDRAAYSASKGALLSLTRAMAKDHLAENIRVNCVCPGTTLTPSLEARLQAFADPEKARAEFVARQPMGRFGTDQEIAAAILYASCDEAAFMTGEAISINGGMTI